MNKVEYLKRKVQSKDIRNERESCLKCFRPKKACFCHYIKPFNTNCRFIILMHPLEAKKSHIGTGRLAHIGLKNSEVIIDKSFDKNERFNQIINDLQYDPYLLYPGTNSINVEENNCSDLKQKKTPLIFIIDGTWPTAKTMMKNTTKLHSLPRLSFNNDKESRFSIKQQPAKYCLSTIESIYFLLQGLEKNKIERIGSHLNTLIRALDKTVEFHKYCASDPSLNNYIRKSSPVKNQSIRKPSKKWQTRNICFHSNR